ncbi:MAG: DUF5686 and carboxypeptidase regulatory-like domain-containing protein [Bacteroidota bacterium]
MKLLLPILALCAFSLSVYGQTNTLSGKVVDGDGEPLPYTNVILTGTSMGTSTNFEGEYRLELKADVYKITFQFIGFESKILEVDLSSGDQTLDVVLKEETLTLNEVVINSGDENPAYAIIRNAQDKRKDYLNEFEQFDNRAYTKIFAKAGRAGGNFNLFGTSLVTDLGIFYLSESVSKINFKRPDQRVETLEASLVSGDTASYSANRAVFVDFYRNRSLRTNSRQIVSPIAADAFNYYDYEYEGYFTDEGQVINKIKLIPKQPTFPAFSGHIYVIEDTWRVYGIHAYLKSEASSVGDIEIKVSYTYMNEEERWVPFSVNLYVNNEPMDLDAYYHTVHYDYTFENAKSDLPISLRYTIEDQARAKSKSYWQSTRPIPLTEEETDAYTKAELELAKQQPDTISSPAVAETPVDTAESKGRGLPRAVENIWNDMNYTFGNDWSMRSRAFIGMVNYNTVEGWVLDQGVELRKKKNGMDKWIIEPRLRYGFSSNQLYGKANLQYALDPHKLEKLEFGGGHYISQISGINSISAPLNTYYSLLRELNYLKIYQKSFAEVRYKRELVNGLDLTVNAEYANRTPLQNTTDFSFNDRDEVFFTPNVAVINGVPQNFTENNIFMFGAMVNIAFRRPYNDLPERKEVLTTKYPEIKLAYEGGRADADYDLVWANISDRWRVGLLGTSELSATYGNMINNENAFVTDIFHFAGNQTIGKQLRRNYGLRYQLLDYYQFSTNDEFFGANFQHHFRGAILGKIPLLKRLNLQSIISANYLFTNENGNYYEWGAGLENIFSVFSIEYYQNYLDGQKLDSGIRIAMSGVIIN